MDQIEHSIESIPALDSSRMRLFHVLQEESSTIETIEQVIASDPAMAAKVIKLANSSFYRHTKRHAGIQQALITIGLDMVKCIALSMAVMDTFGNDSVIVRSLWKHSYAVGLVVGLLGSSKIEKECLFTGGLLHDLGRMVLIWKAPNEYLPLYEFGGHWPELSLERDVFSLDHTLVGEIVAERWHFPLEVIRIIRHHHEPVDHLSALVYLTDQVASQQEQGTGSVELEHDGVLREYLGEAYKELVNTIQHRYRTNTTIVENLG
jgi:putative nucleotidyltransferase with HDIG domain